MSTYGKYTKAEFAALTKQRDEIANELTKPTKEQVATYEEELAKLAPPPGDMPQGYPYEFDKRKPIKDQNLKASEPCDDPIVEMNVSMLRERSALGVAKYGQTLADNPLSLQSWLQHTLEELLDAANYVQAALNAPQLGQFERVVETIRREREESEAKLKSTIDALRMEVESANGAIGEIREALKVAQSDLRKEKQLSHELGEAVEFYKKTTTDLQRELGELRKRYATELEAKVDQIEQRDVNRRQVKAEAHPVAEDGQKLERRVNPQFDTTVTPNSKDGLIARLQQMLKELQK